MDERLSKSFGYLISLVLPGLLGIWAAAYVSDEVNGWLRDAGSRDSSFGSGVLVFLAALGVGIFLSGVRYMLLDCILFDLACNKLHGRFPKKLGWVCMPPKAADELDWHRRNPDVQAAYADIRERFHSFGQFYGNTSLALLLSFSGWVHAGSQTKPGLAPSCVWIAFVIAEFFLLCSAHQSLGAFRKKKQQLLGRTGGEQ